MENSQLKDLQEEVSDATKQYILTTFNSENGMKTYYLQMSNIIRSAHIGFQNIIKFLTLIAFPIDLYFTEGSILIERNASMKKQIPVICFIKSPFIKKKKDMSLKLFTITKS